MERKMRMISCRPRYGLRRMHGEMDRMMMNMTPGHFYSKRIESGFSPRIDITEDEKNIRFYIEVAGVSKDDVKLSVNDENILTIKGEKKAGEEKEDMRKFRNERSFGEFSRSFLLPEGVDSDKIEAEYRNGLLELTIPKLEPVKPKELDIAIN